MVVQSQGRHSYQKVLDGRKQPIRGLYTRNGNYLARLTIQSEESSLDLKWVPLKRSDGGPVRSLGEARATFDKLRTQERENDLPVLGAVPTLADYVPQYLAHRSTMSGVHAKRPATVLKDRGALNRWVKSIGGLRLNQIRPAHLIRHRDQMLKEGYGARSANLALIALRGLCKHARLEGFIKTLPMADIPKLRKSQKKRSLTTLSEIESVCAAAFKPVFVGSGIAKDGEKGIALRNARQLSDYLHFMAFTGARRCEALRVRWPDIDFDRQTVVIGAGSRAGRQIENWQRFSSRHKASMEPKREVLHSRRDQRGVEAGDAKTLQTASIRNISP